MTDTSAADTASDDAAQAAADEAATATDAKAAADAKAASDAKAVADEKAAADAKSAVVAPLDWRADIQDDKVREFASRHNSPADLAKAALGMRQQLSTAVALPGKDATDEQRAEFNKKLGIPETAEGYEVALPEDLPEGLEIDDTAKARVEAFKEKMHAVNAPPAAVQAAVDTYFDMLKTVHEDRQKSFDAFQAKSKEDLTREWGADTERNFTFADRAMKEFGGEDVKKVMNNAVVDGMLLGDHPVMVKMFATLGRRMGSDALHLSMTETETGAVDSRIDAIHALQFGTPEQQAEYKSDAIQSELNALYNRKTGGASIVGAEGRSL